MADRGTDFTWKNGARLAADIGELRGQVEQICSVLDRINGRLDEIQRDIASIYARLGMIWGKVAVWGAIGGIIVAAIIQTVMAFVVNR